MAGGGGCRDERRGSSASEVGTDDGTAKKKKKKEEEEEEVLGYFPLTMGRFTPISQLVGKEGPFTAPCSIIIGRFYIALFFPVQQTHCTFVTCHSE